MKKYFKKIIAIIFTMLMLVNSSFLTLVSIAVEGIQNENNTLNIESQYEIDMLKYVNYNFETHKGTFLKFDLKTGIKYSNNEEYKPIQSTTTELIVPQIKDEYPEKVEVQAISTKATNGNDNAKDWDYEYDVTTGKITICALNREIEGEIYSQKIDNARDSYKINLYYSENCYDENNTENDLEIVGEINQILYTEDSMQIKGDINKTIKVSENMSNLISADVYANDIYNGNIYSNINNGTSNDTQYSELMNINIDYSLISDEIEINEDDKFINNNFDIDTEDIVYKATKINVNNVLDVLGEEGKLQILNNNEVLFEINKDMQKQENGDVVFNFENEISSLNIKMSKPIKVGTIAIENIKAIKNTALDINNSKIKTETTVKGIKVTEETETQKQEIYNYTNGYKKDISESTTRVDVSINEMEWTNNTVNDIDFTIKLVSNDVKYNLFKNPVIEIKLPKDVDKVILGETFLLYNDSNFVQNTEVIENETNKIIRVTLSGVQSGYLENTIYEGIYIVVPTKITLKKEITALESNIELTYFNQNGKINDYEAEEKQNKVININELDEIQEARLSTVRYSLNTLSLENPVNTESNTETINGISFSTTAQVGNKILEDGDIVYEEQIIRYTTKITNNSSNNIENLRIVGKIPEGATYVTVSKGEQVYDDLEKQYKYVGDSSVTEKTIEINKIVKGDTVEKTYEIEVNKLGTNITEKNILSKIEVYLGTNKIGETSINNTVNKAKLRTRIVSSLGGTYEEENKWEYCLLVTNNTQEVLTDAEFSLNIPKWMEVKNVESLTLNVEAKDVKNENGVCSGKITELPVGKQVAIEIIMYPKNLEKNVYKYSLEVAGEVNAESTEKNNTNLNIQTMYTSEIVVTMTSDSEGKEVKYGDEVEYVVSILYKGQSENSTDTESMEVNVLDYLPDELDPEVLKYFKIEYNEETKKYDVEQIIEDISFKTIEENDEKISPDVNTYVTIFRGVPCELKIQATVGLISENKEVQNSVSVIKGEGESDTILSNIVKFTIIAGEADNEEIDDEEEENTPITPGDNEENEGNTDNEEEEDKKEETENNKYEINGQVWIDKNKDGQKGEKEQKASGVTVKLFNMNTNAIVTSENGTKYITTTDNEGKYVFKNLSKGKYIVIFEYDNNTYEVTEYRKDGVSEEINSDIIKKEISIDGNVKIAGVTDIITIDSKNVDNIDAGLLEGTRFDLRLDKYITKITVANSKETKDYEYNNQKLAKVEIASKEIADTKVTITFKIVVTNEGEQPAYISEITDYLPEGLTVSDIKGNYTANDDGSVKIYGLSGLLLKPGASKSIEVTTVATDIGRFVNSAEITLTKREGNLKDIDSTEGNKNKGEDDYSEATVIISVKTGAIIAGSLGILLAIILIIIFVILCKKNDKFKKYVKMSVFLLIGTSILTVGITTSQAFNKAEKQEEIRKSFITNETYTVNSGAPIFLTNRTQEQIVNSKKLHCYEGNRSMCGAGKHEYRQKEVIIKNFKVTKAGTGTIGGGTENKYTADPKKSEATKLNSKYNIYGPYKIERTSQDKTSKEEVKSLILYNTNGNKIKSSNWGVCDKNGNSKEFSINHSFYIKVAKKSSPSTMEIKINNTKTYSYTAEYEIIEHWECFKASNGSHNGHRCSNPNNAQHLERRWRQGQGWKEEETKSKTIKIYFGNKPSEEKAGVSLQKLDDRDGTALEGIGFSFSTTIWSYDLLRSVPIIILILVPLPGGGSAAVPIVDYVMNIYDWRQHTVYLGNNRKWAYSEGTFYTNEEGIVSAEGTLNLCTDAVNDGGKGNNHTVHAYFADNTIIAKEKSIPNKYYGYNKNIGSTWSIPRNGSRVVKANNHQYEVMLSGFVWLDEHSGKLSMTDSEFNGEPGMNGIAVKLKDRNGATLQTTYTSELGIYDEIYGGEYRFYNVNLDQIQAGNYHVEFEYCGIDYQSVSPELESNEGSKAIDTYSRNILDSRFSSVNGNGSQYLNINGVSLNYNQNSQYQSTINNHYGCTVYASTLEAGYDLYSNFTPTATEIRYVNLGLFKKEQTDYALAQDLYNVRVTVNGFQHVYRYGSTRYKFFGESTDEESAWNVGVKFQNNRGKYTRAIYKSDYEYENKEDASKNINVYVTYKVLLKNEGSYIGRINNIIDYCDANYTLENVGYSINNEDIIGDNITTYREERSSNNAYKKYIIDTSQRLIDGGEESCIYIQFKMNKQAILAIMNNGETKHNLIEINSYTTFDDETGKIIAVYDKDSVPGTAVPEIFNTYEDDTDSSRSLQLEFKNERSVEGTVFIDSTGKEGKEAVTGEERIGDGIYQRTKEKTVGKEQVKVTMQEVDEQGNKIKNGLVYTTSTDKYGKFLINNFVAGYYQITYTWGDKEYKVQYYKGTIYNDKARSEKTQKDPYWYRGSEYENDTISVKDIRSDALDNYKIRENIENEMRSVKINTLEAEILDAYKEGYNPEGKNITITKMDSTTPTMAFSVEYDTTITNGDDSDRVEFIVENVDFGIVERAKQALEFSKKISGYKLTLANGQTIVDATIEYDEKTGKSELKGTYLHTTLMGPVSTNGKNTLGMLKTEMDDELIEGAKLDVTYTMKVKNISEQDYSSADYYYYGIKDNKEKVTLSITELLDYVDGRLNNIDPNEQWKETDIKHLKDVNSSMKDNKKINEYRTYLTLKLAKPLATGESNEISLYTSKLLTSTDDNTFDNKSEISEITKNKGFTGGIPVKLIENYFNIGDAQTVVIIPSTGENKNYAGPIIMGISIIAILGVGIILIKKYVIS